jgi:hypothetical protein
MKVLGLRNSPTTIRFCVLEGDASGFVFSNCDRENKIDLPKSLKSEAEKLHWIISEFRRIFDHYGPFDHLAIKQNENVATRYSTVRPVMFFDCIASMAAVERHVSFTSHVYTNLGTNRKGIVAFAESRGARSSTHWDGQMADAVVAAIHNLK